LGGYLEVVGGGSSGGESGRQVFSSWVGRLIVTRLKKIIRFQKRRSQWDLKKLYTQKQTVQDTLEGKLGAIECGSGDVEVQWNNIKECVLDTLSDLVGKVEKRARKP
jgi:hypothetical protein